MTRKSIIFLGNSLANELMRAELTPGKEAEMFFSSVDIVCADKIILEVFSPIVLALVRIESRSPLSIAACKSITRLGIAAKSVTVFPIADMKAALEFNSSGRRNPSDASVRLIFLEENFSSKGENAVANWLIKNSTVPGVLPGIIDSLLH